MVPLPLNDVARFFDFAAEWNALTAAEGFYKNGREKKRKKSPDALAVVRLFGTVRPLVWDEAAKQKAVDELLKNEEVDDA